MVSTKTEKGSNTLSGSVISVVCLTVFTEVASKLSGKSHLFCTQLCKGKKNGNVTVKNYLNESLFSLLCFSFFRKGFDVNCQKFL